MLGTAVGLVGAALNESPSEKEGKSGENDTQIYESLPLNESPSEKEGKLRVLPDTVRVRRPSMKVPPKRKGNRGFPPLNLTYIVPQ